MSSGINLPNFSSQIPNVANAYPNQDVENFTTNLLTSLQLINELDKGGFFKKKETQEDYGKALGTLNYFLDKGEESAKTIPQELEGVQPQNFEEINMFNPKGGVKKLFKKIFLPGEWSEMVRGGGGLGTLMVPTDQYLKKKEEKRKKEKYEKTPEGRKAKFEEKEEERKKKEERAVELLNKKNIILKLFKESQENPLLFQSRVSGLIRDLRKREFLEGKEPSEIDALTLAEMLDIK